MRNYTLLLIAALLSVMLSACQTPITDIEHSPYYTIPVGSGITLNSSITFPPDKVSVYLQEGALQPFSAVNQYRPHCKFELYEMRSAPQTIEPDTFTIYKSTYDTVSENIQPLRYAARYHTSAGGPSPVAFTAFLYLKSEVHKNVYRLSCLHWEDPVGGVYATVAEIRQTLGNIMTLKLNDPRSVLPEPGQK